MNNVVNVRTFSYLISYASNTATLPSYLPKACFLPNEFLIPVVYPQSETAFQNNCFSNTDHLELNLKEINSSPYHGWLWLCCPLPFSGTVPPDGTKTLWDCIQIWRWDCTSLSAFSLKLPP